jgi:hypothetical protein
MAWFHHRSNVLFLTLRAAFIGEELHAVPESSEGGGGLVLEGEGSGAGYAAGYYRPEGKPSVSPED